MQKSLKTRASLLILVLVTTFVAPLSMASAQSPIAPARPSIQHDIQDIAARLKGVDDSSAEKLATGLQNIYAAIFNASIRQYDPSDIQKQAPQLIHQLFELRMWLRSQINNWNQHGLMTPEVIASIHGLFRQARYAEDMIGEMSIGFAKLGKNEKLPTTFSGKEPELQTVPRGEKVEFQTGDVLLVRGNRVNSAAIARIADDDSQFSHLAIIYRDPATNKAYVVEALIEDGVVIHSLDEDLNEGMARMALFRHHDPELAKRAASIVYQMAKTAADNKQIIPYDFSMELTDNGKFYCSKLVRYAFQQASQGKIQIPTFPSTITKKNRDFLTSLEVTATTTFAPGDIELETQFDLIAEWRDFRKTEDLRMKDMILTKIFEWMERDGATFNHDILIAVSSGAFKAITMIPFLGDWVEDITYKVPYYMAPEQIGTMIMLQLTADRLQSGLTKFSDSYLARYQRRPHPREMLDSLEQQWQESGRDIRYLSAP